ncbi:MAG TPA: phosphoribosylaminoimidazolesuccinocarboxamide synthase [Candidatus Limnocylindrales bacterium]|nr:phosphoribosylaminoimidazolesuccinocarboxamide synthase [Candidatus Limnocylindrales bacterium]
MPADAFVRSGKVRDLYAVGGDRLLLVASDRISAFDVVLPTPIPDKGRVLTGLSRFWFRETAGIVANHVIASDLDDVDPADLPPSFGALRSLWAADPGGEDEAPLDDLRGRILLCERVDVLPVEVIVRGYLAGSGWRDYRATGSIGGIALPAGLRDGDRLPEPIVTPSTKAELGEHDETIDAPAFERIVGERLAERIRDVALRLYAFGVGVCEPAGIILADTKLEFGTWAGPDDLLLVDELFTPDSSRFWDASTYAPGGPQPSFDKQYVRDWLESSGWDKRPPGPSLPAEVVAGTRERYVEAYERITGASFDRYLLEDVIAR